MSRTYRRQYKSKNHRGRRGYSGKSRNGEALMKELPVCYRHAVRTYCAAAGTTKWLFKSQGAAINAAKFNYYNKFNNGKQAKYERAYHCSACGGFHLTTMNRDEWKVRKAELAEIQGLELDENGNFTEKKPLREYYGQ